MKYMFNPEPRSSADRFTLAAMREEDRHDLMSAKNFCKCSGLNKASLDAPVCCIQHSGQFSIRNAGMKNSGKMKYMFNSEPGSCADRFTLAAMGTVFTLSSSVEQFGSVGKRAPHSRRLPINGSQPCPGSGQTISATISPGCSAAV